MSNHGLLEAVVSFFASDRYQRCVLLVDEDPAHLRVRSEELAAQLGWPRLSVGRALAEELRDVSPRLRPHVAARRLGERLRAVSPGPVICGEIDLFFEPSLALNPPAMFAQASRVTALVVCWPGSFQGGTLVYATPEHGHVRTWPRPDAMIVGVE